MYSTSVVDSAQSTCVHAVALPRQQPRAEARTAARRRRSRHARQELARAVRHCPTLPRPQRLQRSRARSARPAPLLTLRARRRQQHERCPLPSTFSLCHFVRVFILYPHIMQLFTQASPAAGNANAVASHLTLSHQSLISTNLIPFILTSYATPPSRKCRPRRAA
jgi:hypothetical protein